LCDSPTRCAPTWPAPTMPELPEVESLRRILVRTAVGRTIVQVRIGKKRLRRRVTANFGPAVAGRRIVKLSRRAKYLIVELDGDDVMLVHLGMSGSLTHRDEGFDTDEFDPRHDHLEFSLDDGSRLVYNDPRRFGRVTANFGPAVAGRRIVKLSRRAKYLIVELDGEDVMLVHLGMSGSLTHRHEGFDADEFDPRHDHLEFSLDDGSRLVYNDPRRFGMVSLVARAALAATAELKGLGPEPLSREFNADYLAGKARGRTASIKNLIMDQRIVAGIGNIYACRLSCRQGARPHRIDQEPDYGSTNRRRYRQYLRFGDFISRRCASDAPSRPRHPQRD